MDKQRKEAEGGGPGQRAGEILGVSFQVRATGGHRDFPGDPRDLISQASQKHKPQMSKTESALQKANEVTVFQAKSQRSEPFTFNHRRKPDNEMAPNASDFSGKCIRTGLKSGTKVVKKRNKQKPGKSRYKNKQILTQKIGK